MAADSLEGTSDEKGETDYKHESGSLTGYDGGGPGSNTVEPLLPTSVTRLQFNSMQAQQCVGNCKRAGMHYV